MSACIIQDSIDKARALGVDTSKIKKVWYIPVKTQDLRPTFWRVVEGSKLWDALFLFGGKLPKSVETVAERISLEDKCDYCGKSPCQCGGFDSEQD